MKVEAIEWPTKGCGEWWVVENRGAPGGELYLPVANGPLIESFAKNLARQIQQKHEQKQLAPLTQEPG